MPMHIHRITVFIGGPGDTKQDRAAVAKYIDNVMSKRCPRNVELHTECFDHPDRPVGVELQGDWQENIDRTINPGSQDFGIMIFRWRLGKERERDGKRYPSMSAYEVEQFLAHPSPPLAIFRYSEAYDYKLRLRDDFVLLPVGEQQKIVVVLKKEQEEYERLEAYLQGLKNRPEEAAIPTFRDRDELLRLVDSTLWTRVDRILKSVSGANSVDKGKRSPRLPGWPFFSFKSLNEQQNEIFFGREDDVRSIVNELRKPELQFLCIHGSSGTGKSSLLKAGILPALVVPELAAKNGIEYHPRTV